MKFLLASLVLVGLLIPDSGLLAAQQNRRPNGMRRPGQRRDMSRRGRQRQDDAPRIGDIAPVFTLQSPDGESETDISQFQGEKPVILIFGSYT